MDTLKKRKDYFLPASIVIAAVLIAGALIYTSVYKPANSGSLEGSLTGSLPSPLDQAREVSDGDHVLGSKDAPIVIVEFSDTECPFCQRFHSTMHRLVLEYKGQVAWVYRHFPIPQLHPKALKEAEATECAAEFGGNEKFWKYLDRIYEITPTNNGLDPKELSKIAEYVGLDVKAFESCVASGKYEGKVKSDTEDAIRSGGEGTPYSILITKDGTRYPINGALPYERVKLIIDTALQN